MTEHGGKVVAVDFYEADKLPPQLAAVAKEKNFKVKKGLVAVRTRISSPPSYEFDEVGSSPDAVKKYMQRLAKEDGTDLSEAVNRAFAGSD